MDRVSLLAPSGTSLIPEPRRRRETKTPATAVRAASKTIVSATPRRSFEARADGAGRGLAPAVSLSRNSVSLSVCHGGVYRWVLAQCVAVGELLGYARVSTTVQDPALEHDALRAAGCRWLWTDTASGSRSDRVKTGAARVLTEDVCVLASIHR